MNPLPLDGIGARVELRDGRKIPVVGLGVFQTPPGAVTQQAVRWALEAGYRHIDTAAMYGNEVDVGTAVRESGVPREEVFVTTKLWHTEQGYEPALRAARRSAEALGLGYIDLYLIHWPRAPTPEERLGSWKAFEELQTEGLVRSIGVSNFAPRHLEPILARARSPPVVNQIEFHPFVYDSEILAFCDRHKIRVEAYSPLTRNRRLDDPTIAEIARAHARSPAQVMIRWGLQHGVVELPKSVHRERIEENARVFDFALSTDEMARLDALRDRRRVTQWDPTEIP